MIVMVGLTVLSTVGLANISNRSREPIPAWMDILVLKILSRIVCLGEMAEEVEINEKAAPTDIKPGRGTRDTSHKSIEVNKNDSEQFPKFILTSLADMSARDANRNETIPKVELAEKWKVIAVVVSRCFALLFTVIMVTCTVTILIYIKVVSEIEFANALGKDRDKWLNETFISLV